MNLDMNSITQNRFERTVLYNFEQARFAARVYGGEAGVDHLFNSSTTSGFFSGSPDGISQGHRSRGCYKNKGPLHQMQSFATSFEARSR